MSTSEMAQEFAGLPGNGALGSKTAGRFVSAVNMYLPAYATFYIIVHLLR